MNEKLHRQQYELKQLERELMQLKKDHKEQRSNITKMKQFFKNNRQRFINGKNSRESEASEDEDRRRGKDSIGSCTKRGRAAF